MSTPTADDAVAPRGVLWWKKHAAKSVDAHLQQLVGQFNMSLAAGAPWLKILPAPVPIMGCQLRSLVHSNQPIEVAELTRLLQDRICLTDGEGLTMCEQNPLVDFLGQWIPHPDKAPPSSLHNARPRLAPTVGDTFTLPAI